MMRLAHQQHWLCPRHCTALQVACLGHLQVVKREGFWGHRDQVLPDLTEAAGADGSAASAAASAAVAPLGQLEFVLDRRRQRRPGSGGGSQGGGSQDSTP